MAGLADLFNSPTGVTFGGKTYMLRQPTVTEALAYQRTIEEDARANAARSVDLPEEDRRQLLRDVNKDITAKVYAWGQEVCVLSLRTVDGIARLMSIICADQGMTEAIALRLCDEKLRECVAIMGAELDDDPKSQRALLAALGLRPDFLTTSSTPSSDSPTPRSGTPSTTSGG